MAADRYVVLGLAHARASWFADVSRWATSGALPIEFVKVVTVTEVRARLRSGRPFSALLAGAGSPGLDRDLIELADRCGCPVLVVDDGHATRPWDELGVAGVLPGEPDRARLLDALRTVARPLARPDDLGLPAVAEPASPGWRGRLVAVTGPGGAGRSTLATALATGLAADPRDRGLVVLADLALDAHQALIHDAGDVMPGVLELADGHRAAAMNPEAVRALCFAVDGRGYDLLLGVRRHRDWAALRRRTLRAALDGLCRTYRLVVADVDADVEGERQCGVVEVEERNVMARTALAHAELVAVVGVPGLTGIHAQLRVVRDLLELGVAPARVVPVVNRAPRHPRARAEHTAALARLLAAGGWSEHLACTPVFVPERRRLDDVVRDGGPPPVSVVAPVADAVRALLDRTPPRPPSPEPEPVPVAPGTLGSWSDPSDGGPDADGGAGEAPA